MWGPDGLTCMKEAELSRAVLRSMTNNCGAARASDPVSLESPGAWKSQEAFKQHTEVFCAIHASIPSFDRHLLSADNEH